MYLLASSNVQMYLFTYLPVWPSCPEKDFLEKNWQYDFDLLLSIFHLAHFVLNDSGSRLVMTRHFGPNDPIGWNKNFFGKTI